MRALALDVGSRTIGLALSDESGRMASPWEVLRRRGQGDDVRDVLARVRARDVEVIVVGLPLELDGSEGHRVRLVRRFVVALEGALGEAGEPHVRVELWDERFSTAAAERSLIEGGMSRERRKQHIDAMAAQFILQGWLDGAERSRRGGTAS